MESGFVQERVSQCPGLRAMFHICGPNSPTSSGIYQESETKKRTDAGAQYRVPHLSGVGFLKAVMVSVGAGAVWSGVGTPSGGWCAAVAARRRGQEGWACHHGRNIGPYAPCGAVSQKTSP